MKEKLIGIMFATVFLAGAIGSFFLLDKNRVDENKDFEFMKECINNNTAQDCKDLLKGIGQR